MDPYRGASPASGPVSGYGGAVCPVCTAPLRYNAPFCDVCQVQLRFESNRVIPIHPEIRRGDVLLSLNFARDPFPNETKRDWKADDKVTAKPLADGIAVDLPIVFSYSLIERGLRVRDACVRATFTVAAPDAFAGVVARAESLGTARTQYQLEVLPGDRAVRIVKFFRTDKASGFTAIIPWTQNAAVAPPGHPNEVELRVQGATLQGWINGRNVLAAHDLSWGIGEPGIRFGRKAAAAGTPPSRVVSHGFEVCGVTA